MGRAPHAPRLLLLAVVAAAAATAAIVRGDELAVFEATPREAAERGRTSLDKWTAQAASERGLVNVLLGNQCFTTAIAALNRECTQLSNEQRCWLAIQFTMCFQRASGLKVMACPTVCPRRRALQSCVEECTASMDDKAHVTYSQFFGDVFNMCLFLQAQNFQQVTAALVQDMHSSSVAANASLAAIRSEVSAVGAMSARLQDSMAESLELTGTLGSRQTQLLQGFSTLEQQHQAHAARAAEALSQLAEGAAALEARQARYETLQARLLNASEHLLDQSQGMASLLQVLAEYQTTGHSILSHLQSSSSSLHDVLFYTVALSVPLLFWTSPTDVRLLLLAGVLGSWACERAAVQHHAVAHRGVLGHGTAALLRVQDVKITVRALLLGLTLSLIIWLLTKRRAAEQRREAIFLAIQKSMEDARFYHHQAAAAAAASAAAGAAMPGPDSMHYAPQQPPATPAPATTARLARAPSRTAAGAAAAPQQMLVLPQPQQQHAAWLPHWLGGQHHGAPGIASGFDAARLGSLQYQQHLQQLHMAHHQGHAPARQQVVPYFSGAPPAAAPAPMRPHAEERSATTPDSCMETDADGDGTAAGPGRGSASDARAGGAARPAGGGRSSRRPAAAPATSKPAARGTKAAGRKRPAAAVADDDAAAAKHPEEGGGDATQAPGHTRPRRGARGTTGGPSKKQAT